MTINQGFGKIQTLYQKKKIHYSMDLKEFQFSTKPYDEIVKLDKNSKSNLIKKQTIINGMIFFLARVIIYQISR